MRKRITAGLAGALLALSAVGGVALADDGSVAAFAFLQNKTPTPLPLMGA